MRENNNQLHNSVSQKNFASEVNIIFVKGGKAFAFAQKREVIFPGSFSIGGNIKYVPSQLTSLLSNSASSFPVFHWNLSISPAKSTGLRGSRDRNNMQ